MQTPATIRVKDANHCVAIWNQTLIILWRHATTPAAVSGVNRFARALLADARGPVTSLSIIESTSEIPGAEARAELVRFSRDLVSRMALAVIAAEGGGFRGSIVRSVGVTLTTLAPHRVPFKFVETLAEGAIALAPHLPVAAGGADGLVRAIQMLRADIEHR
jgi:hypothetical protein